MFFLQLTQVDTIYSPNNNTTKISFNFLGFERCKNYPLKNV